MKKLIGLAAACLFLLMPVAAAAADIASEDTKAIDKAFETFMADVNAHNYDRAYENFMLPLIADQPQLLRNLVGLTKQVAEFFVEPIKYEKVRESSLGSRLIYRQYVLYNERAPYLVTLVMMRTDAGWKAQHITLRDLSPDDVAP